MPTQAAAYRGRQQMNCHILLFHIETLLSVKRFVTLTPCFCGSLLFIWCHGTSLSDTPCFPFEDTEAEFVYAQGLTDCSNHGASISN